jgi:type II secretory pathway predicted ATPase ExeA
MTWQQRFGMHGVPLPRGAAGPTFFADDPHLQRLARSFAWLAAEPGIGVLVGEPGVGKTAAMRHFCHALPQHEHRVVYLHDTAVKPLDLYRMLAVELGLRPGPRAAIVRDIQRALVTLVDERGVVPIIVLDEAQRLHDDLLRELSGLVSLDFDGREYLTVWLIGQPLLARRLALQQHAALAQRVIIHHTLSARTDPVVFAAMLDHALAATGAPPKLLTLEARTLLHRISRGIPRLASHLLHLALFLADDRDLNVLDEPLIAAAAQALRLEPPKPPPFTLPPKPRPDRDARSRG